MTKPRRFSDYQPRSPTFPGPVKVQRIRANLKMPTAIASISTYPSYMMGMGPVDEVDLPALATQLKAADAPTRAEDVRDSLADIGLAKTLLDYEPQVDFREGLRKTVEWYKSGAA